jgi:DNA-binding transcriptional ArsR family regulator
LAEPDNYDRVFAALKHPVRRQILLFIEGKGEVSFTEIQDNAGLTDTGLLSYHLKELAPLLNQSERGKYSLSEVGIASMALFRKVEKQKQYSYSEFRHNFGRFFGELVAIWVIIAVTLMPPLSANILLSVQTIASPDLTGTQAITLAALSVFIMLIGCVLFVFFDRRYYSTKQRTNTVHAALFALGIAGLASVNDFFTFRFMLDVTQTFSLNDPMILSAILRTASFIIAAPIVAYELSRFLNNRKKFARDQKT